MKTWTTEDIQVALGFEDRSAARNWVRRFRKRGVLFKFEINDMTGEKRYYGDLFEKNFLSEIAKRQSDNS